MNSGVGLGRTQESSIPPYKKLLMKVGLGICFKKAFTPEDLALTCDPKTWQSVVKKFKTSLNSIPRHYVQPTNKQEAFSTCLHCRQCPKPTLSAEASNYRMFLQRTHQRAVYRKRKLEIKRCPLFRHSLPDAVLEFSLLRGWQLLTLFIKNATVAKSASQVGSFKAVESPLVPPRGHHKPTLSAKQS